MRTVLLILFSIVSLCGFSNETKNFIDITNNSNTNKNLCTPSISTGVISGSPICAGTLISIPFSFTDCVDPSNIFIAELSDAFGSFTAPTTIGVLASNLPGTISAIIPTSINVIGSAYRIRVNASAPATVGADNGVNITIIPKPNAFFNINAINQCINTHNYNFTNASTGSITSYEWSLGDGTVSTNTSVSNKTYSSSGIYNVKLLAIGSNGCKDSITRIVSVNSKPFVNFNIDNNSKCQGEFFNFQNTSSNATGSLSYTWQFGNGATSTNINEQQAFNASGLFFVKLIATSVGGCVDSSLQSVNVLSNERASFTLNDSTQCLNVNSFVFNNFTSGNTTSFWNFGDGTTSTVYSPVKFYSTTGNYVAKLLVTNTSGCKDSLSIGIRVLDIPKAGFAFSNNTNCTNNLTLNLLNTSTGVGNTYLWSFGDGTTSTATNPSKTYTTDGNYFVKLVVTNAEGCKDSLTQLVTFTSAAKAQFTINNSLQCLNNDSFILTNTSLGNVANSFWSFGDGITSNIFSPVYSYNTPGVYTIKLVVTNANGCRDSISQNVLVYDKPTSGFTITKNCTNANSIQINNNATGATTYFYDFGDGTTSILQNPTKIYALIGTYVIKQIVTNANGCKDTSTQTVTLNGLPNANFTINNANQCFEVNSFNVTNTSTNFVSSLWDFGDGSSSSLINPNKSYSSSGVYAIKLIVTNVDGCKDSITQNVTVNVKPTSSFSYSGATGCTLNRTIQITDISSTNGGVGSLNYFYDFGDGTTSTQKNPTKIYTTTGTYTIKQIITNLSGCKDSSTQIVKFSIIPTASYTVNNNTQCLDVNSFVFINNSSNAVSYAWDFADGTTSSQISPSKSYVLAGTYTPILSAFSIDGCKSDFNNIDLFVTQKPSSSFSFNGITNCTTNRTVVFADASTNLGGGNLTYLYNFGDGTTSTQKNPTKTYTSAGTFLITQYVTNNLGCIDSFTKTVTFTNPASASFVVNNNSQCLSTNNFAFVNTSTNTLTQVWSFGDGSFSTQFTPNKVYSNPGTYPLKLVVTSIDGCRDSTTASLTVNPMPTSSFNYSGVVNCTNNRTIQIVNNSIGAASYFYDFGDGTTSTNATPTKTYSTAGNYLIKQVVINANGCKDSSTKTVNFFELPVSTFTVNNNTQCFNGNSFSFTNSSINNASNIWSFGDASTSTQVNPVKVYDNSGVYNVQLIVATVNGCRDTSNKTITVNPMPVSSFAVSGNTNCTNNRTIQIVNNSSGANSYFYAFGDGTNSTLSSPIKTYLAVGRYTVKQVLTSLNGCKDSSSQVITFTGLPTANFSINNSNQCVNNNNYLFTNSSIDNILNSWSFGDGSTSTQVNPSKVYSSNGNFTVRLIVTNNDGCTDTMSKIVNVLDKPVSNFNYNIVSCGATNTIQIVNSASGATIYHYDFGDGTTSNSSTPSKTYSGIGSYIIKQVVTNINGCKDSSTQSVTFSNVSASYTINNTTQCLNANSFVFANNSTGASSSSWSFGDGSTSTSISPIKVYTTAGTYNIKLIVANISGCKDSTTQTVTVYNRPVSGFVYSSSKTCSNDRMVTIFDASVGALNYTYDFGDGTIINSAAPTHIYASQGTYIIKQVVTNANGCKDSSSQFITFTDLPTALYTINNTTQCLNANSFVFANNSTGATTSSWSFGDGSTSSSVSPTKVYTTSGTYNVKLVVSNAVGCVDSITQVVTVHPKPVPSFTYSGLTSCTNNLTLAMNNTSAGATSYNWSFGDGQTSIQASPTITYATAGTYTIKLVATSVNGCKDSTTQTVTFTTNPVANYTINNTTQCLNANSFVFTNTSVGATTSTWSFGDGSTSSSVNPTKVYTTSGTYNVKLLVANAAGCKDSVTQVVTVNDKPTSNFTYTGATSCTSNLTLAMNNTSVGATSYNWSFGDGQTSIQANPTYTYATAGTYTIKLISTNVNGCKDSTTHTVTFTTNPVANYAINNTTQCLNANSFVFTNTSVGATTSSWSFGDGSTSSSVNPTKVYTTSGTFNVKLVVSNAAGCKDSVTQVVTVNDKPTSNFTYTGATSCTNNLTLAMNNTSAGATSYNWSFGDGQTSSLVSPTITYATAGTYTIKLVATSVNGCKDSTTQTVTFTTNPVANYTINNTTQCLNANSFVFTNTSVGATTSSWSFGDGSTSSSVSPTKVYTTSGTYNVKLVVSNAAGCKDSITQVVTVHPKPVPSFTYSGATSCTNNLTLAMNNTSVGATTYNWSFGDGQTSSLINPTITYATAGTYTIKLVATSVNGCKDSTTQTVTFTTNPVANYTINNTTQCLNANSFVFTNTSVGATTSSWSFGDGSTSSSVSPTKVYTTSGTYNVKLVVSNAAGCKDSITQVVTVHPKPVPSFTYSGATSCTSNLTLAMNNTSAGATTYNWSFGNGQTSSLVSPTITYATAGTYTIKLVATSVNGCKDSTTQTVTFTTNPVANFNASSGGVCSALTTTVNIVNNSTNSAAYFWSFGDGNVSTVQNPTHTYATSGTFIIKLKAISSSGCQDSTSQNYIVAPQLSAQFNVSAYDACGLGNPISFTNNSTNATSSLWSFGDGNVSGLTNPTILYSLGGTYQVKLVVVNILGCKDSTTKTISIYAKPKASFNYLAVNNCNKAFVFTNTSSVNAASANYYWTFGDGTFSLLPNPTKAYNSAETYTVTLIITNSNGCKDTSSSIVVVDPQPVANFITPGFIGCATNNLVNFQSTATNAISYSWDFGDGSFALTPNFTKTYTTGGTYNVKLVVANSNGCKDSVIKSITIKSKPSALFNVNSSTQCINNNSFIFSNLSTINSLDGMQYLWSFGDGSTSTVLNPIKTYTSSGSYTVRLIATGLNGNCSDTTSQIVNVTNKPTANFNIENASLCSISKTINFTNTSISATNYSWSFGDGNVSSSLNANNTYTANGSYIVSLIATNASGCNDTVRKNVEIVNLPKASYTINDDVQCLNGNQFVFTNSSSNATTYVWSFGNGVGVVTTNSSNIYATAGTYNTYLVARNINGCTDTSRMMVTVNSNPEANFNYTGATNCTNNLTLQLNNTSLGIGNNFSWNFGDGTTSNLISPNKVYASIGTYKVSLVVTNASGCIDSAIQEITFTPKPTSSFTIVGGSQCVNNNTYSFVNNSVGATNYSWSFGDGKTSTQAEPTTSYSTAGNYTVTLTSATSLTCVTTSSQIITVLPKPNAAFNFNNFNACRDGLNVALNNTSTGAASYSWTFGNGVNSTQINPIINYATSGTYKVTLNTVAANGCIDSVSRTIMVNELPTSSFTVVGGNQCVNNNSYSFTNNSTNANSYSWNFGNGQTSTDVSPTLSYTNAGTYTITLTSIAINGCSVVSTRTVTVYAKPSASFSHNNSNPCLNGLSIQLTNTSVGATAYTWNFGNGVLSNITSPNISYAAAGSYTVTLVATNANGCIDSVAQNITVVDKVAAAFNVIGGTQCVNNNSYSTTNTSVNATSYSWNFGNGQTSTDATPTFNYNNAGNYTITLTAIGATGCTSTVTRAVSVLPKPNAAFNLNSFNACRDGLTVKLNNTTTGASGYTWDFGNGIFSNQVNPTISYATTGTYTISLIATNTNGCSDTTSNVVTIVNKPTSLFTVVGGNQCVNSNSYSFINNSTNALSYDWNFGNGQSSILQSPTISYSTAGTFTVTLTVTSADACTATSSRTITVLPKPTASFSTNGFNSCISGNTVTLSNTSLGATTYNWNFGNGSSSASTNATVTYATSGTYRITLTATNSNGCVDTTSQVVNVYSLPTAAFNIVGASTQCAGNNISFNSNATNAVSYAWNFGNSQTANTQNAITSYNTAGTYNVTLTVTGNGGCTVSTSQTINIVAKPIAAFTATSNNCTNSLSVSVTNNSTNASGYEWNFGDGTIVNASTNPIHTYATAGTYNITLTATNSSGCIETITKSVTVYNKPISGFSLNSTSQCISSNNFIVTNTSTDATIYNWNFGNGQTSTLENPIINYSASGNYTIRLIVTNANGCRDTSTQSVSVLVKPTATFNTNGFNSCTNNNTLTVTNNSTNASSYSWSFGDGGVSNQVNPTYTYNTVGTFIVRLIATNANGCSDTSNQSITVTLVPNANFTTNTSNQCLNGNSFVFTANNNSSSSYLWNFGDGTSVNGSSIQNKTYSTPGTYTATLTVNNSTASCSKSFSTSVTVTAKPTAAFNQNGFRACRDNNTINLINQSTGASSYSWNFGDGSFSNSINPQHTYTSKGVYNITLVAINTNGCIDSTMQTIQTADIPNASFVVSNNSQCLKGNSFVFSANNTSASSYSWSFGDGTSLLGSATQSKIYANAGTYVVTLVVGGSDPGCIRSFTNTVNVNANPRASFTINNNNQCINGNRFVLTNTSNNATNYVWDFGDSSGSTSTNAVKVYTYTGQIRISLIASNNSCSDTAFSVLNVLPKPAPAIEISANNQCTNSVITFTNTNRFLSERYLWKFGDGTFSSDANPTKTYTNAGNYVVTLVSINDGGCRDSVSVNVLIANKPVPTFSANAVSPCSNTFQFVNTTIGSVYSSNWDFGNSNSSNVLNPQHTYGWAQTYFVKLKVQSAPNCVDSVLKQIVVYPKPNVYYTQNAVSGCVGSNSFVFNSQSSAGTYGIRNDWSFGDGTIANGNTVTKTYTLPGTYQVKLVSTVIENGCRDSVIQPVTIFAKPAASISGNTIVCNGSSAILQVKLSGVPPYSFIYTNGLTQTSINNVYDTVYNLNIVPNASATYSLVSMSDRYCSLSDTNLFSRATVEVKNLFFQNQPQDITTCIGKPIVLTGKAYSNNTTFTYQWIKNGQIIPNATKDTFVIVNPTTADAGFYRLTAITSCGTFASNVATVKVEALPTPPVFTSPYTYCQFANATQLTATGSLIKWYSTATGGLGSTIAPTPSTQLSGVVSYWVTNSSNTSGCESQRFAVITNVLPAPTIKATVTGSRSILPNTTTTLQATASSNSVGIRWYYNRLYMGLTPNDRVIVDYSKPGTYYAEAITNDGCKSITDSIVITRNLGNNSSVTGDNLIMYPNPVVGNTQFVNVYFNNPVNENVKVRVVGALGHIYKETTYKYTAANQTLKVDISGLMPGTYFIEIIKPVFNSIARGKFVKM